MGSCFSRIYIASVRLLLLSKPQMRIRHGTKTCKLHRDCSWSNLCARHIVIFSEVLLCITYRFWCYFCFQVFTFTGWRPRAGQSFTLTQQIGYPFNWLNWTIFFLLQRHCCCFAFSKNPSPHRKPTKKCCLYVCRSIESKSDCHFRIIHEVVVAVVECVYVCVHYAMRDNDSGAGLIVISWLYSTNIRCTIKMN